MRIDLGWHVLVVSLLASLCACATPDGGPAPFAMTTPGDYAAALRVAREALEQDRYSDAEAAFGALVQKDLDSPEARLGLAEARLGLAKLESARDGFAIAARENATRTAALQGLGLAALRLDDVESARAALEAAVAADPTLWRAWNGLGRLADGQKAWDDADRAYGQALTYAPAKEVVLNNMGVSLMARGDNAAAANQFARSLEANGQLLAARHNLQVALGLDGQYSEVLGGVARKDRPRTLNNLGYAALLSGDYERAEAYLSQALEDSPDFYSVASRNLDILASLRPESR